MNALHQPRSYQSAKWDEPIILEMGAPGERGYLPPAIEPEIAESVGAAEDRIPASLRRREAPRLPEMAQPSVLRHYLRLSQMTMGAHITPDASLGTCTMKYSPSPVNEQLARTPQMGELHPYQDDDTAQGMLQIIYRLEQMLCEISGMDAFTFQPAAPRRSSPMPASSAPTTRIGARVSSATRSFPPPSRTRASIAPPLRLLALPGDHARTRSEWLPRAWRAESGALAAYRRIDDDQP